MGPRRLRKVAWQSLKKDPVAQELWDGCMPAAESLAGDWPNYLVAMRQSGAWASLLEIRALAKIYRVNVKVSSNFECQIFQQTATQERGFSLSFSNQHYTLVKSHGIAEYSKYDMKPTFFQRCCVLIGHFCTSNNSRGGSSRATKRKQSQKNGLQSLQNLRLPDHFLAPLIPMLIDMLSQYKPVKKLKPKRRKTSSHPSKQPEKHTEQPTSTEPCWYHLNGGCRFGDKCHFSHDKRNPSPQETSALNKTDRPRQQPDKAIPKAWGLRPNDWDGKIFPSLPSATS